MDDRKKIKMVTRELHGRLVDEECEMFINIDSVENIKTAKMEAMRFTREHPHLVITNGNVSALPKEKI